MKSFLLPLLATLVFLPACQNQRYKDQISDQESQIESLSADRQRLIHERDRASAENSELQERLTLEQIRANELQDRIHSMESAPANPSVSDAEVEGLQAQLEGTGVGVGRRGDTIVLDLPQAITFASGKAELSSEGKSALQAVTNILKNDYAGRTFWVEGHTDNDPIKKSGWSSNLHLSVIRALAVADHLTKELGIDRGQVRVAGHGANSPRADNDSNEGKSANRRVEILILN